MISAGYTMYVYIHIYIYTYLLYTHQFVFLGYPKVAVEDHLLEWLGHLAWLFKRAVETLVHMDWWEILQENLTFNGKIYGFCLRCSLEPIQ